MALSSSRKDPTAGIQYRVGEYTSEAEGWQTLATIAELRGEPGQTVGEIGAPIIFGRADFVATSAQTDFDYSFASTDELLVYVDGVLQQSEVRSITLKIQTQVQQDG